jgi:hypothetical protein
MARESNTRPEGYTLDRAINDVFGRLPLWPWSAVATIAVGGAMGAAMSSALVPADSLPHPALRWAACAGYGIVAAALLTLIPRAARLFGLRPSLAKRPADDGGDKPWWPLRLLAAALRGTPALRRTQQDFNAAITQAGPQARSILAHRLWPACVAAFIAPVLGLLSAWEAGKQMDVIAGQDAATILKQFVPQVSPPMVATIAASLTLMVVVAILDQATKGLLQRWATTVRLSDGDSTAVTSLVDDQGVRPTDSSKLEPTSSVDSSPRVTPPPREELKPEDLQTLMDMLSNRGKDA